MNTYVTDKRARRKYSRSGIKAAFLARNADGSLLNATQVVKSVITMIREMGIENDIDTVFLKEKTKEFFITTNTTIFGLEDLKPEFAKRVKKEWTNTFHSFTIGVYTVYTDQSVDITELVMKGVFDEEFKGIDYWNKKMINMNEEEIK